MGRAPNSDKNGLKKGPWTSEEDQKLVEYIKKHGYGNWRTLPKNAGLERCGKSCRLRWTNYLRPDIKRGKFTFEEEETIIQLHSILGNKWSCIAARLPGRTDNEIKNYWNTHIRKKLLRMGIDPVTHNPRLDLLDVSTIITSSLFNPSQMNMSRLLGIEPFVNPELLKLATSILSSSTQKGDNNQTMFVQNVQENDQMSNQFDPIIAQSNQIHEALTCNNFTSEETQFGEQFSPSTLINFGSQSAHLNECQQSNNYGVSTSFENQDYVNQDYVNQVLNYEYYDGSEQIIMDNHQYDNSNFKYSSNDSNQDFSFTSIFSTPSSTSPTLTEDERETSYCSNNMLKFETQDNIFDHVNEFIM